MFKITAVLSTNLASVPAVYMVAYDRLLLRVNRRYFPTVNQSIKLFYSAPKS